MVSIERMASALLHCTLFLFLLVAGLCYATDEYNILEFTTERRHEQWMAEYGRVYKDEAEKARRLDIYKKNVRYIEDFNNAGEYNYTLGVNQFADLTFEEFLATYAGGVDIPQERFEELAWSFENRTVDPTYLPSSVDWRAEGVVNPVKNQGKCGSCWAFAAVATVEILVAIRTRTLHNLSEQQVLDCDMYDRGCKGGYWVDAYTYIIRNGGLTTGANYPYQQVQRFCDRKKERQIVASISTYISVEPYNEAALMAAVAKQPVAVGVRITQDWQFYNGGVYSGPCGSGKEFNHAVVIVGYVNVGRNNYWIVRNSWGPNWAERGYIMVAMGVAGPAGLCGIAKCPSYPV